jgi:hypothetical protein
VIVDGDGATVRRHGAEDERIGLDDLAARLPGL